MRYFICINRQDLTEFQNCSQRTTVGVDLSIKNLNFKIEFVRFSHFPVEIQQFHIKIAYIQYITKFCKLSLCREHCFPNMI